jgi:HEPN domain-containing protein
MSRYPIEVKEGVFLPPEEFYKKGDAERMLNGAHFVLGAVKRFLDVK